MDLPTRKCNVCLCIPKLLVSILVVLVVGGFLTEVGEIIVIIVVVMTHWKYDPSWTLVRASVSWVAWSRLVVHVHNSLSSFKS